MSYEEACSSVTYHLYIRYGDRDSWYHQNDYPTHDQAVRRAEVLVSRGSMEDVKAWRVTKVCINCEIFEEWHDSTYL